jgi:hypothetical protein
MLLAQSLGLKVYHVDITATHNTAVNLETASILGVIPTLPQVVGCVVIESALGGDANGIPYKVIGAAVLQDPTASNVIKVTVQFSASITRDVRVAILIKE